jgi:Ca2+-transporting ATPase
VTDSLPAFALGIEKPEKDVMKKPPRATNSTIFSGIGWHILWQGFAQTFVVMIMFVCALNTCGNVVASTMVFVTICLMQIIHAVNCKSVGSLVHVNVLDNKTFNISFVALLALILFVALVPPMQTLFGLASLNTKQWLIVALVSVSIIPVVEICKFFINHGKFKLKNRIFAPKFAKLKHKAVTKSA